MEEVTVISSLHTSPVHPSNNSPICTYTSSKHNTLSAVSLHSSVVFVMKLIHHTAKVRGLINIASRRTTDFHRQANKCFELNFIIKKLSSTWSDQVGKIILTACQFVRFLALNENTWKVSSFKSPHSKCKENFDKILDIQGLNTTKADENCNANLTPKKSFNHTSN